MRRLRLALCLLVVLALVPGAAWAWASPGFHGGFHNGFHGRSHRGFDRGLHSHNGVVFRGPHRPFFHHPHFFRPFVGPVFVSPPVFVGLAPSPLWVPGSWQWAGWQWVWVPGRWAWGGW
jgi:hypothetical protein